MLLQQMLVPILVTAEPNGDNCRIDESVTVQNATFTITKQEITAPVVAISNFAKGSAGLLA